MTWLALHEVRRVDGWAVPGGLCRSTALGLAIAEVLEHLEDLAPGREHAAAPPLVLLHGGHELELGGVAGCRAGGGSQRPGLHGMASWPRSGGPASGEIEGRRRPSI